MQKQKPLKKAEDTVAKTSTDVVKVATTAALLPLAAGVL